MATSNWAHSQAIQSQVPHTYAAMQGLIMAMADYYNRRGKTTWFGNDRGLAAYKKFEDKLRDTLLAMVIDNLIRRNSSPTESRRALIAMLYQWAEAHPNWPDAYAFGKEYFVDDPNVAEDRIRDLLRA